jgi:hypothetical protein
VSLTNLETSRKNPIGVIIFGLKATYCVDTVGLDSEMIRKYVPYQEKQERRAEQQPKLF